MSESSLIKIHTLSKSMLDANELPSVYPIEPMGLGTGQLECLTGLTLRLADRHSMFTIRFYKHVFEPIILPNHSHSKFHRAANFYSANGYGKFAKIISSAVTKSTRTVDAFYLTALPWVDIFDRTGHGLVKNNLEWCEQCWHEDMNHLHEPYVRLAWMMKPVSMCPHHLHPLNSICPNCNHKQQVLPSIPRPWICCKCGYTLYEKTYRKASKSKYSNKDYWIASAVERFIEKTSIRALTIKPNSLTHALQGIVGSYSSGSYKVFSEQTQIHHRYLREWALNIRRPTFQMFMELCYRMDIPPDILLLDELPLTDPDNWRREGKPEIVIMKKLTKSRKDEIHNTLDNLIRSNPNPPISLSKIAKNLGVSCNIIRYHFPEQYKTIRSRFKAWQDSNRERIKKERLCRLYEGVQKLISMGIYPSERKLKEFDLILPSVLRLSYVKTELCKLQRSYLSNLDSAN